MKLFVFRRSFRALIPLGCLLLALGEAQADDPPPRRVIPPRQVTPITVRGKAVDAEGKPVVGATVRLLSVSGPRSELATTTTDEAGAYVFTDAQLLVRRSSAEDLASGAFQVYGTAPGMGFAWHGRRFYQLGPRPPDRMGPDEGNSWFVGEAPTMNLTFFPAATLGGRVVDEAGQPIAGARVRLVDCDYLDMTGKESFVGIREFDLANPVPAAILTATTAADGRFRLTGLPREVVFRMQAEHADYALQGIRAATTAGTTAEIPRPGAPIIAGQPRSMLKRGDLLVTLQKNRQIRFHAVAADTGQPVPGAWILMIRSSANAPTLRGVFDKSGHFTIPLPPGVHPLMLKPPDDGLPTPGGKPYVQSNVEATVTPDPAEQTVELRLELGCLLTLEAVDAATGQGVPDVAFFAEIEGKPGFRLPVQETTTFATAKPPRTNPAGRVRAVVYAGERAYSIASIGDPKYEAVVSEKRVMLPVGGDVTVRFELRKVR